MKKSIIFILMIALAVGAKGQHKIESPHPDLEIEIKRVVVSNKTAIIDLLMTNMGGDSEVKFTGIFMGTAYSSAFDDEGNKYSDLYIGSPNKDLTQHQTWVELPQEVPMKFRVQIENVDPNASAFKLIKIAANCSGPLKLDPEKPIIIRNLEFTK